MQKTELLLGTLDMLILKVHWREPIHGFGICRRIHQLFDGVLNVGQGSFYPAHYRWRDRGWIVSEWGQSEYNRQAKSDRLTEAERKQLEVEKVAWGTHVSGQPPGDAIRGRHV